jgi:hypothetical protein
MAQLSARQITVAASREWRTKGRFADLVISKLLAKTKLTTSNRAFALEIFYGVLLALKPRKKSKSPNRAAGREAQLHLARSMES